MSKTTRINRPTYATPRKNPPGRLIHISTNYNWIQNPLTKMGQFVKLLRGNTYRSK